MYSLYGFDPFLSIQKLSARVGASRVTVRRRMESWRSIGFWKRVVAFPNPDALGTSFQMQAIVLDPGPGRSRSERALLDLLDPVILFQVDDIYTPLLLAEPSEMSATRQRRLERISGIHIVSPPVEFPFAPSAVRLALRDWRILRAFHQCAGLDWQQVATKVGLTVRGLQRRVAQLMAGGAIFFFPEFDFRHSPGSVAWVGVFFGVGVPAASIEAEMVRRFPDLLRIQPAFPVETMIPGPGRGSIGGRFLFFLPVPSAATGDQLRRELPTIPGIVDVLVGFPTQNICFPSALAARIETAISPKNVAS